MVIWLLYELEFLLMESWEYTLNQAQEILRRPPYHAFGYDGCVVVIKIASLVFNSIPVLRNYFG